MCECSVLAWPPSLQWQRYESGRKELLPCWLSHTGPGPLHSPLVCSKSLQNRVVNALSLQPRAIFCRYTQISAGHFPPWLSTLDTSRSCLGTVRSTFRVNSNFRKPGPVTRRVTTPGKYVPYMVSQEDSLCAGHLQPRPFLMHWAKTEWLDFAEADSHTGWALGFSCLNMGLSLSMV